MIDADALKRARLAHRVRHSTTSGVGCNAEKDRVVAYHVRQRLVYIGYFYRQWRYVIRCGPHSNVVNLDSHIENRIGLEVQCSSGYQVQLQPVYFEQRRIVTAEAQFVRTQRIVGHHYISNLDPDGCVSILWNRCGRVLQFDSRRLVYIGYFYRQW